MTFRRGMTVFCAVCLFNKTFSSYLANRTCVSKIGHLMLLELTSKASYYNNTQNSIVNTDMKLIALL